MPGGLDRILHLLSRRGTAFQLLMPGSRITITSETQLHFFQDTVAPIRKSRWWQQDVACTKSTSSNYAHKGTIDFKHVYENVEN
ncbi:SH3 domain-binding protein 2 [Manis javanica]|nr:SH3 domain-binding protein 2 [Manis javanica]